MYEENKNIITLFIQLISCCITYNIWIQIFCNEHYWRTELLCQIRCQMCNGYGYRTQSEQRERCINCSLSRHGRGRQDCNECDAKGKLSCSVCEGHGQILCYIRLTVTWLVESYNFLSNSLISNTTYRIMICILSLNLKFWLSYAFPWNWCWLKGCIVGSLNLKPVVGVRVLPSFFHLGRFSPLPSAVRKRRFSGINLVAKSCSLWIVLLCTAN